MIPWVFLLAASCSGLAGRAPNRNEFDAAEKGGRPPDERSSVGDSTAPGLLEQGVDASLLRSGDELRFTVLGEPGLSFEAKVPADGALAYPLIGRVTLAGRTPEDVRIEIKDRLDQEYFVSADVSVLVKEYSRRFVHVVGAVAKPVVCEVPGGRTVTLLQVITQAGGFSEDAAKHSLVIYRSGTAIPFNAVPLEEGRGRDPVLAPDDIVLVPSREKVYVLGQVGRPGAYVADASRGLTACQAIALAGGVTRIANDANVRLLRRDKAGVRQTYVLDLSRVVNGKAEKDEPLQPGDILFVPESVF
jgi:polysaccharide export outer membrane protein